MAVVSANCVPVSCMPSPESPANRMTTSSSSWTARLLTALSVSVLTCGFTPGARPVARVRRSGPLGRQELLLRAGRKVRDLRREMLGDVLLDVARRDHAGAAALTV